MGSEQATNHRLREAMESAGFTHKSLARAVVEASHGRGRPVQTTRTRVAGWLTGGQPRKDAADALVEAFKRRTGRLYSLEELGFVAARTIAPDLGLTYERDLVDAARVVRQLAEQDLAGHPDVHSERYSVTGLQALCLDWVFGDTRDVLVGDSRQPVTARHVEELRAMTQTYDEFDRRFGGENHRRAAVRYLHETVAPRLTMLDDRPLAREYLHEAAVLCELIGWMSYDGAEHSAAQRYFAQAVRLAQAAGDEGYASYVVTSLADQALFVGQPRDALRFAQVARNRASSSLPSVALIEARVFEARAYAVLGDQAAATEALVTAEQLFDRLPSEGSPTWAAHWSHTVLASHAATLWIDLGQPEQGARLLQEMGEPGPEQPRRGLYRAVQASRVAQLQRDLEQATEHIVTAVRLLAHTSSKRSWQQVDKQVDTLSRIAPNDTGVIDLREQLVLQRAAS